MRRSHKYYIGAIVLSLIGFCLLGYVTGWLGAVAIFFLLYGERLNYIGDYFRQEETCDGQVPRKHQGQTSH